ncbi:hypothetical protein U1Q18_005417 [Sarracenia purpurea var. burkii]
MNSNSGDRKTRGDDADHRSRDNTSSPNRPRQQKQEDVNLGRIFLFGLAGATATTLLVGRVRRTVDWLYSQWTRSHLSWKGATGGSSRSSSKEEAWKRYNRRMQEEYEEEMERVERIRRIQSVFNRERNKYKRSYESWSENGSGAGAYQQNFQREDWYWKTDTSYRDQRTNFRDTPLDSASYPLSHHYSVLGLDRAKRGPYTDDEIKTAFRAKAKEFHPDQNQDNKVLAEAKFKQVMTSYEAIKMERKKQ